VFSVFSVRYILRVVSRYLGVGEGRGGFKKYRTENTENTGQK